MTERLYYHDSFLDEFDAQVVACEPAGPSTELSPARRDGTQTTRVPDPTLLEQILARAREHLRS